MITQKINLIFATSLVVSLTHVDLYDAITAEECNKIILEFCGKYTKTVNCFEYLYFNRSYADVQNPDGTVNELLTEFFEQFIKAIDDDGNTKDKIEEGEKSVIKSIDPEGYCYTCITENSEECRLALDSLFRNKSTTQVNNQLIKNQTEYSYFMYAYLYIKTDTPRMAKEDTSTSTNSLTEPQEDSLKKPQEDSLKKPQEGVGFKIVKASITCCASISTTDDNTTSIPKSTKNAERCGLRRHFSKCDHKYEFMNLMFLQNKNKLKKNEVNDILSFCEEVAERRIIIRNVSIQDGGLEK